MHRARLSASSELIRVGVPVELVETTPMHGFSIPTVLLTLRTALAEAGGLAEEGIFRVAPDGAKCAEAERQLGDAPLAVPAAAVREALRPIGFRLLSTAQLVPSLRRGRHTCWPT